MDNETVFAMSFAKVYPMLIAKEGVGISVMKPSSQVSSSAHSPFGQALTHNHCLQYTIDRPGVPVAVPGVQTMAHWDQIPKFPDATDACPSCGRREERCPFGVKQATRMVTIDEYVSRK